MEYRNLTFEVADGVAKIALNRPEKLNALTNALLMELADAMFKVQNSPEAAAAVITGAGEKAFCAGADLGELGRLDATQAALQARKGQDVFELIETLGKPVIAAVNGMAFGGGCELAMACTLRIAAENARFGQPEVKLGLIPGYGGTQRLPRLVGKGLAMELILTGRPADAQEALRIGLVNRVVPQAALMEECLKVAREIRAQAPLAVRYAMEAVNRGMEVSQRDGLALEAGYFGLCFATKDMQEGVKAFQEKRKPTFEGR